jgi:hypothetical protein
LSKPTLQAVIDSVMRSVELQSDERVFLERWVGDTRANAVWSKIEIGLHKKHGEFADGFKRPLIYEVLAILALANYGANTTAFLKQAQNAESLASFLRGPTSRPHPPLLPNSDALVVSLTEVASALRKLAENQKKAGLKQVSRQDRNRSRARVNFMRSVGELLMAFCGQFLDDAGIFLTDIAFPEQETALDQIRSSRRPTTRTGRGKLAK